VKFARWIAAPLLALALYWGGLTAWFQKDDFAWLNLWNLWAGGKTLWWILFQPLAQGTIRTLSERIFFTSLYGAFGLHPLPYHLTGMVTFAISLVLLQSVTSKLTGSPAAGFWAAIFWAINAAVAIPLAWTSVYYELLCAFFFLLDVWLLLCYLETLDNRFYIAQVVTFLLGFFVLELNVVYPAIAMVIVLCRKPTLAWKIFWLFPLSVVYTGLHFFVAPHAASGPYKLYWDLHLPATLLTYVNWALGTGWLRLIGPDSFALRTALALPVAAGLIAFLVWKLRERQWIVLLFPAWFLFVLAPLLPLRQHMMHEYLTIPVIGLAMWGGWALATSPKAIAIPLALIYAAVSIPVGHAITSQYHDRSLRLRDKFHAVEAAYRAHPGSAVILRNVDQETFEDMIYHHPFTLIGIDQVYLESQLPAGVEGIVVDIGGRVP
jgi:hypothetical protein